MTAYAVHLTPLGRALALLTSHGLAALRFADPAIADDRRALVELSSSLHSLPTRDDAAGREVFAQLDEYFAGDRRAFELELDWGAVGGFTRRALEAVRTIPYAETASYGEVAVLAGSPGAHRAAGTACGAVPFSVVVPVHRVIRADGSIGPYGGHPEIKRFLLDLEQAHSAPAGV